MGDSDERRIFRTFQYYKFCAYGFLKNLRFFDAFIILILREVGFSYFQIGTLYSIREISKNLFEIPSGIVADSYGRKNAMIFSFSSYLISFLIFYFSTSYLLFASAMLLFGMGEAFRSGTHKAMILSYLERNHLLHLKTQFYGRTRSWSQMGSALSSLLAIGIILWGKQYRLLFLISALPYFLDLVNLISYPKYLNHAVEKSELKHTQGSFFHRLTDVLKSYFRQFAKLEYWRQFFSAASYGGFFKALKDYFQPMLKALALQLPIFLFLTQKERTSILVGLTYFLLYILTSLSARNAFRLEKRFKRLSQAIDAAYLAGIGITLLAGVTLSFGWPFLAALFFVGLYLVRNMRRPLIVSYLSETLPSNIMASGLSTMSQMETLIVVLLSPVIGYLVDWLGLGWGIAIVSLLFLALFPLAKLHRKS